MSIQKYPGDWQEGNTTTPKRAARAVAVLLALCVLIIIGIVVRLSTATSSVKSASPIAATMGILQPINLPITPTVVVVVFENATPEPLPQTSTASPEATTTLTPIVEPTLEPVATLPPPVAISVGSVTSLAGGSINIRSGPGLNYSVLAFMHPNQQAQVVAQSSDGNWWRVDLYGQLGWLRKDTVQFRGDKFAVPIAVFDAPTPTAGPGR